MTLSALEIVNQDIERILSNDLPWDKLSGSSVAVTGASGFIGSYLTRTLLALNKSDKITHPIQVFGIVRNTRKAKEKYADVVGNPYFKIIECDLSQPYTLTLQVDWFIHAASQASPKYYNIDPVGTLAPNVIGTHHLLRLAQQSQAKGFMFVSSSEVYGNTTNKVGLAESDLGIVDTLSIRSCYAESKRMGETLCVAWLHQYKVPTYIVRPFHTYGPLLELNDGRVFADFVSDIVCGRDIVMTSDGAARRAFCYITDAISGFFHVLLKGDVGQAYNVANPDADLSILELAELLIILFPDKNLTVQKKAASNSNYMKSHLMNLLPDVSKLSSLGWHPQVKCEEGFKRMVKSYL